MIGEPDDQLTHDELLLRCESLREQRDAARAEAASKVQKEMAELRKRMPLVKEVLRLWLAAELSTWCEEGLCASWIDDWHYIAWRAIKRLPETFHMPQWVSTTYELERVRDVSEFLGEWYVEDAAGDRFVPIDEWHAMYDQWEKEKRHA